MVKLYHGTGYQSSNEDVLSDFPWKVAIWNRDSEWPDRRISIQSASGYTVCINPRYIENLKDFNLLSASPDLQRAVRMFLDEHGDDASEELKEIATEALRKAANG